MITLSGMFKAVNQAIKRRGLRTTLDRDQCSIIRPAYYLPPARCLHPKYAGQRLDLSRAELLYVCRISESSGQLGEKLK